MAANRFAGYNDQQLESAIDEYRRLWMMFAAERRRRQEQRRMSEILRCSQCLTGDICDAHRL